MVVSFGKGTITNHEPFVVSIGPHSSGWGNVEPWADEGDMKEIHVDILKLPCVENAIVDEETITQQYWATLHGIADWTLKDIVYKK